MKYRTFGNTGIEVSALGFGCMRLPVTGGNPRNIDDSLAIPMVRHAIAEGVNYFDTAYPYHAEDFSTPGASEPFLARALGDGYRQRVHLATKLPCWLVDSRKQMDQYLEEQLTRLNTDHIDFYLLHSLNRSSWNKIVEMGVEDFLNKAIASGKIRFAGFSFHDDLELFKEIVDAYPWSFTQIMYNYYDVDFQAGREGLEYATNRGLGMVVMEPLRGGALVTGLPQEARQVLSQAAQGRSEVDWAFRWLWRQPGVHMVLSGMSTMQQVEENLALAREVSLAPWDSADEAAILKVTGIIQKLQKVSCTSCGYCIPCPEGVDIPRNFMFLNDHYMLQDRSAKVRYTRLLSETQKASNCIECGICLDKCPQQIPIPDTLQEVADLFGS